MEQCIGTLSFIVRNGNKTLLCETEILDMPTKRDMVIGLSCFRYKRSGVLLKYPNYVFDFKNVKRVIDETPEIYGMTAEDSSVAATLEENKDLPVYSRYTLQLAILKTELTDTTLVLRSANSVKEEDVSRVTAIVNNWLDSGVIKTEEDPASPAIVSKLRSKAVSHHPQLCAPFRL